MGSVQHEALSGWTALSAARSPRDYPGDAGVEGRQTLVAGSLDALTVKPATLIITDNDDLKIDGELKSCSGAALTQTGLVDGDAITGLIGFLKSHVLNKAHADAPLGPAILLLLGVHVVYGG